MVESRLGSVLMTDAYSILGKHVVVFFRYIGKLNTCILLLWAFVEVLFRGRCRRDKAGLNGLPGFRNGIRERAADTGGHRSLTDQSAHEFIGKPAFC